MAQTLQATITLSGTGSLADDVTDVKQLATFGGAILPTIVTAFSYGTGNNQVNKQYLKKRTLAATTFDLLDLTALTDFQGAALNFAKIKYIFVGIISPDGTKSLRVGPQNQTNAFAGFWGGTGATVYDTVLHSLEHKAPISGLATGGTTKILPIYNPGASSLDYAIWILGTDV